MSLIGVDEMAARLDDPKLRIVDLRWYLNRPGEGRLAYERGHVPSAIYLDLDLDLSDPTGFGAPGRHPLPSPTDFRARLAAAGIGSEHLVVGYDDIGGASAARLWWMLDNLGHRGGAAVLDGGIDAWVAAGQPLTREVPQLPAARLELAERWHNVIERGELASRLGAVSLLDARAPERYRGEVEPIDPAAGHIPTALCFPTGGNLADDGRFLPPERLRERYAGLTATDMPVVTSCGSGTTACHNALAMRLAGLPDPILYVGSFSDWSRSGMRIATGAAPGEPT
jgi:thiosulfate/3-mercaptopyruvate sulfurtransferase